LANGVAQLPVLLVVFHVATTAVVAQPAAGAGNPILATQIRLAELFGREIKEFIRIINNKLKNYKNLIRNLNALLLLSIVKTKN